MSWVVKIKLRIVVFTDTARPVRHVNPISSPAVSIYLTILSSVVSTCVVVGDA